jgi:CubicO group peptidase (beta-lactamase class C family)
VLQLVDEGVLGLDDELADDVDVLAHDSGSTLRQLLEHTA